MAIGRSAVQINTTPFVSTVLAVAGTAIGAGWFAWGWVKKTITALRYETERREADREKDVLARRAVVDIELERKNTALANLSRDIEMRKSELLQIGSEERARLRERIAVLEAAEKTFKDGYDGAMRQNRELLAENASLKEQVRTLTAKVDGLQKQVDKMNGK